MTEQWRNRVAGRIVGRVCALGIAVVVGILVPARTTAAEDAPATDETPSKWEFEALPYAWLFGTFGSATVKGTTVQIDAPLSDTWDLLVGGNAFAAAGYFSASYDRFSFFADSMGGYEDESVNQTVPTQLCNLTIRAKDKLKVVVSDFAFGYRLGQWSLPGRERPFTLGVYVGTRYMHFGNRLHANAGVVGGAQKSANVEDTFDWADPMIGVRWSLPVLDSVSLDLRSDIGGFHASSDLIWGIVGSARYWLPWKPLDLDIYATVGYRVVDFDRGSSAGNVALQFRGPLTGVGFVF